MQIVDDQITIVAGSSSVRGEKGGVGSLTGDGGAATARFMSPFGLTAVHSNILVIDGDRIRLITPTEQSAVYLKHLLAVAEAFGMKVRDGENRLATRTIADCLTALVTFGGYLDSVHAEAQQRTLRLKQTDGVVR